MFITLRSSGRGQELPGSMEQVARRNAGPTTNNGQMRTLRRPACIACQKKKLRCTGGAQHCDRCKEKAIECIFPTTPTPTRLPRGSTRSSRSPSTINNTRTSPSPTDARVDSANHDGTTTGIALGVSVGTVPAAGNNDSDFLEDDFLQYLDVDLDMTEFSGNDLELHDNANGLLAQTSPGSSGTYHSADNQPFVTQNTLATFLSGPDSSVAARPPTSETIAPSSVHGNPISEASQPPTFPPPINQNSTTDKPPPACQCLNNLLHVVQQFDDDEFHLTSLPLDQVIQLEKWLTFQCYRPLDCPNCLEVPAVHSVILILCDRLTELFECTNKRIERAGSVISSHGRGGLNGIPPPLPISDNNNADGGGEPTSGQLFCGTTKGAAILASCNPMMFSDEFRTQYSDEEQMHMIRVLIRLQMRNYRQLLLRVEQTSHSQNNHARQWKVKSMIERLAKTSTGVEGGLQFILGLLESGQAS